MRIDFGTREKYFRYAPHIIKSLLELNVTRRCVVYGERQINLHRNPNMRYEYFMRGILATMPHVKYVDVCARTKNVIATRVFDWTYEKCASKKKYVAALATSTKLAEAVRAWRCAFITIASDDDYKLIVFDSPLCQKKYDDFVDTLLLLNLSNLQAKLKSCRRAAQKNDPPPQVIIQPNSQQQSQNVNTTASTTPQQQQ